MIEPVSPEPRVFRVGMTIKRNKHPLSAINRPRQSKKNALKVVFERSKLLRPSFALSATDTEG